MPVTKMSRDEMRRALKSSTQLDEKAIERVLDREFPPAAGSDRDPELCALELPLRLVLPWSALCSDNLKTSAIIVSGPERGTYPKLVSSAKYAEAKRKTRAIAKETVGQRLPTLEPVRVHAVVWVPDNRPGHDVCNLAKCCLDALQGVVYANDDKVHAVTWERAGVDIDRPRAEIEVRPL